MRNPEQTIGNLIDRQTIAMLGSLDEEGYPNIKAMLSPRKRQGIRTFWFTTNASSLRTAHFRQNPKACLYFCDRRFYRGVMLLGTVEVLEDAESKEAIWLPDDTKYYSAGVTDPDYCVLTFIAEKGRYYSSFQSENFSIESWYADE